MIGSRILAATVTLALVGVLGSGGPRPEVALTANAAVAAAADRTLASVDRLQARLAPAVEAARAGSARVVAGAEDPAGPLVAAADGLTSATQADVAVRVALSDLERARTARDPGATPLPPGAGAGELASIAGQLEDAAELGASFAESRRRAEGVSSGLVDALDAAAAGEPDEAHRQLLIGLMAVDQLRGWQDDAPVLSVWITTADAMIGAMQRLVDAVKAQDAEEAEAARADFESAVAESEEADRALRIGLGEAGNAVTAVPLGRLADVIAALDQLELAVRAAREEIGP